MTRDNDDFEYAGNIIRRFESGRITGLLDGELALIIKVQEQVIRFLNARGPEWMLAVQPLRIELEGQWKSMQDARKRP